MASVLTRLGYQALASLVTAGSPSLPAYIGWGFNPNVQSAGDTDIALFNEAPETRTLAVVTITTTNSPNDTAVFTGTLTSAAGGTLGEVGIMDAVTAPFTDTVAVGTIIGSSSGGTATLGLTSTTVLPLDTYVQLDTSEVVQVASASGTPMTVTRGVNGSSISGSGIPFVAAGTNATEGVAPGGSVFSGGQLWYHADFTYVLTAGQGLTFSLQVKIA